MIGQIRVHQWVYCLSRIASTGNHDILIFVQFWKPCFAYSSGYSLASAFLKVCIRLKIDSRSAFAWRICSLWAMKSVRALSSLFSVRVQQVLSISLLFSNRSSLNRKRDFFQFIKWRNTIFSGPGWCLQCWIGPLAISVPGESFPLWLASHRTNLWPF